MKLEFGEIFKK